MTIAASAGLTPTPPAGPRSLYGQLHRTAQIHGDAFHVFEEQVFRKNYANLRAAFQAQYPRTQIAYSYKTNYTPRVCRVIHQMGGFAEVVSEMEYAAARRLGVEGARIIYNGPYKSAASIRDALQAGATVNVDSRRDYEIVLAEAAAQPKRKYSVGARCNFEIPGVARSRFGLDVLGPEFKEVTQGIRRSRNVTLGGLHCHFPHRDLESFGARAQGILTVARKLFPKPPRFLNLGGGFCGSMPKSLARRQTFKPPSFAEYAAAIGVPLAQEYGTTDAAPTLCIEPGTALVANTFKFYARVISVKEVGNRKIATVAGSIFNISPQARTPHLPVRVIRPKSAEVPEAPAALYDIAGYTCIEGDYLTRDLIGPVEVGDFVEYRNLGSYSIVMKPPFILPNVPILSGTDDKAIVLKRGESMEDIFRTFPEA